MKEPVYNLHKRNYGTDYEMFDIPPSANYKRRNLSETAEGEISIDNDTIVIKNNGKFNKLMIEDKELKLVEE